MRLRSLTDRSLQAGIVGSGAVDDQHAAVAVMGDRAGDAAEDHVLDPGEAARADRDQRRVVRLGGLDDRAPHRAAFVDGGGRIESQRTGALGTLLGGLLGAFLRRVGDHSPGEPSNEAIRPLAELGAAVAIATSASLRKRRNCCTAAK